MDTILISANALGITFSIIALQTYIAHGSELENTLPEDRSRTFNRNMLFIKSLLLIGNFFIISSAIMIWNALAGEGNEILVGYAPAFTLTSFIGVAVCYVIFVTYSFIEEFIYTIVQRVMEDINKRD